MKQILQNLNSGKINIENIPCPETHQINPYEILSYIDSLKNNGYYPGREMADGVDPTDEYFGYFD